MFIVYISQIMVYFGALNFKLERGVKILKMVSILGIASPRPVRLARLDRPAKLAYSKAYGLGYGPQESKKPDPTH